MSKNKQESKPAVQVKQLTLWEKIVRHRILILMCLPAIIYFIAFSYAPLPGIWVAFVKYNYRDGIFGSKFIGLDNFEFLATSGKLLELTKNTVLYNLAFILLGNFLAVFVAILLNEIQSKWFKKASQTVMFLPYFISQVLVGILVFYLLNYDTGLVNGILRNLGVAEESLWQPYSTPGVWPVLLVIIYLWHRRRDDGGGEGGRSQRLPEDTLHTSSQLKAYDSGTAALRTGRHRERQLRSVL